MHKVYLACPYSHKDEKVKEYRFEEANKAASNLIQQGCIVFSPISHSVPISRYLKEENYTYDVWLEQDFAFLDWCDSLYVLCLPGWEKSIGVKAEIERAESQNKIVRYLKPDEL